MPTNMIANPSLAPTISYDGVELFNAHAEEDAIVLDGTGPTYGRAIFDLSPPLTAGATYLLDLTISDLAGGLNPQVQIVCAEGGPMNLVSGENRFTVRSDLDDYSKLAIKGSGTNTTARLSGFSLTE